MSELTVIFKTPHTKKHLRADFFVLFNLVLMQSLKKAKQQWNFIMLPLYNRQTRNEGTVCKQYEGLYESINVWEYCSYTVQCVTNAVWCQSAGTVQNCSNLGQAEGGVTKNPEGCTLVFTSVGCNWQTTCFVLFCLFLYMLVEFQHK